MRAVWVREFGGPEVLVPGWAPEPVPGAGQVVVRVSHANITFVETQFRASGRGPFAVEPPFVPGNGVAGTVVGVGEGVDRAVLGRSVVTATGGSGGYAELALAPADGLYGIPDGLAPEAALALLADGRTAAMLVETAGVRPGDRVLVEAAGGGVGSLLVQLAGAAGAEVTGAAGGATKLALARELGAHATVDYTEPGWAERVGQLDVVFDGVGGEIGRAAFGRLGAGGRMVSFGLASGSWAGIDAEEAGARDVTLLGLRPTPDRVRAATEHVLAEAAAGRLRPVIGRRFPLERAADAHRAIESRATLGKTLLDVAQPGPDGRVR
ncbi:zinc-binding dehydrogenase [Kitasatospora terrestris]|uniref:Zinc-binding dehydrogenase n=1 Tax=Kitasatospora terrestris TaxID=258051 RepID=A0ABP9ECM7_9ACTN